GQEPGVVAQLDDLDDDAVGAGARRDQAVLLKRLAVFIVKLVAMAMALTDLLGTVSPPGQPVRRQHAGPRTQPHRTPELLDRTLVFHQSDHWIVGRLVELGAVGLIQLKDAAGELDDRAL